MEPLLDDVAQQAEAAGYGPARDSGRDSHSGERPNFGKAVDLRCHIREQLITFLAENYPEALPRLRTRLEPFSRTRAKTGLMSGNKPQTQGSQQMNTANLQMEGMLMAVATLCRLMRSKGIADTAEIDAALAEAEAALAGDSGRPEQLSQANVEAALFPLRFLREANRRDMPGSSAAYTEIATTVGRARRGSV